MKNFNSAMEIFEGSFHSKFQIAARPFPPLTFTTIHQVYKNTIHVRFRYFTPSVFLEILGEGRVGASGLYISDCGIESRRWKEGEEICRGPAWPKTLLESAESKNQFKAVIF